MESYLEDTKGKLCFKHAVKKVIEGGGRDIKITVFDDSDCGQSGCWWVGDCYECNKEVEKEKGE